jgi:hypothetical protein
MARPRFEAEAYVQLAARISTATLAQIERYLEHLRQAHPGYGLDRSAAVRALLLSGLDQAGFGVSHGEEHPPGAPPRSRKKSTVAKG